MPKEFYINPAIVANQLIRGKIRSKRDLWFFAESCHPEGGSLAGLDALVGNGH
jgi:hypothetical protein